MINVLANGCGRLHSGCPAYTLHVTLYALHYLLRLTAIGLLCSACTPHFPSQAQPEPSLTLAQGEGIVLPPGIAPITFHIPFEGDACRTHIFTASNPQGIVLRGSEVKPPLKAWHKLLSTAAGDTLFTTFYVRRDGRWMVSAPLATPVAAEPCDSFIAYRLIQPGYVEYERLRICQRTVSDYTEQVIYDNTPYNVSATTGQCVNCHSFRDYNRRGDMQLHLRENHAGTLICRGDDLRKVSLKTDSTRSAGVYPAWHPTKELIAYSVNSTGQAFHTRDQQKVEVIDYGSDLILYDIDANAVTSLTDGPDEYETFPTWSPEGLWLYYTAAHYHQVSDDIDQELNTGYQRLRYNIYRRPFNPADHTFGSRELVYDAAADSLSAALPRISPDGRWLLFSAAGYGQFHIWHKDARLYALDLQHPGEAPRRLTDQHASYHSWSSNGRWILFATRADDGNYTRLSMACFSSDGTLSAPLRLPQSDPDHDEQLMLSYNIPEWLAAPVRQSRRTLTTLGGADPAVANYQGQAY